MKASLTRPVAARSICSGAFFCALATLSSATGFAQPLAMVDPSTPTSAIFEEVLRDQPGERFELPAELRRQVVAYATREPAGTIVVDTPNRYLYYVLGEGRAIRYGIGVGREGFTWTGVQTVSRKAEWPDWTPPPEMIERQKYLPRWVAGGPGTPLGARAMYLGATQYRIHGTNDPTTIGKKVSSGCIRLTNEDVTDLYSRVKIGAKVVVLPDRGRRPAETVTADSGRVAPRSALPQSVEPQPVGAQPVASFRSASRPGLLSAFGLY